VAATDWVEEHRRIWSGRFDALEDVLRTAQHTQDGDPS
jgi:hypothetical protein